MSENLGGFSGLGVVRSHGHCWLWYISAKGEHGSCVQFERISNKSHHVFNGETGSREMLLVEVCVCVCVSWLLLPARRLMCCHQGFFKGRITFSCPSGTTQMCDLHHRRCLGSRLSFQVHSPADRMTHVSMWSSTIITANWPQQGKCNNVVPI